MDISSIGQSLSGQMEKMTEKQQKKEEVATEFEKIFARQLVSEMTKDSFKMGDKNGVMGQANSMYRYHIINTLSNEIAKQRKLGMADMITKHFNI